MDVNSIKAVAKVSEKRIRRVIALLDALENDARKIANSSAHVTEDVDRAADLMQLLFDASIQTRQAYSTLEQIQYI